MKKLFLKDIYKEYEKETMFPRERKVFMGTFHLFAKYIIGKAIEGEEVVLHRMGSLRVIGKKQKIEIDENGKVKGLAPNWAKTKRLWETNEQAKLEKKVIYNTNEHSDGIRYRYNWIKKNLILKNKTLYSLRLSRENKRALYRAIKMGNDYVTI